MSGPLSQVGNDAAAVERLAPLHAGDICLGALSREYSKVTKGERPNALGFPGCRSIADCGHGPARRQRLRAQSAPAPLDGRNHLEPQYRNEVTSGIMLGGPPMIPLRRKAPLPQAYRAGPVAAVPVEASVASR